MTPEQKAKALVEKFGDLATDVVDEILEVLKSLYDSWKYDSEIEYWQQVRKAITLK